MKYVASSQNDTRCRPNLTNEKFNSEKYFKNLEESPTLFVKKK